MFEIIIKYPYLRILVIINICIIISSLIFSFKKLNSNGIIRDFGSNIYLIGLFIMQTVIIILANFKKPIPVISIIAEVMYFVCLLYRKYKLYTKSKSK